MTKTDIKQNVYVVTRNKRRIEDKNYFNAQDAEARAEKLRDVLRQYDPMDVRNVSVVSTKKPNQIR